MPQKSGRCGITAVLVDMQTEYVKRLCPCVAKVLIPAQERFLSACIRNDVPIIVLEMIGKGETIPELMNIVLSAPSKRRGFVYKEYRGGFTNHFFQSTLVEFHTDVIVGAGMNASKCVMATLTPAIHRYEYQVITSPELVANEIDLQCPYSIANLRAVGVGIVETVYGIISILEEK